MRFDDSLETVLSADMSSPLGAQSAWRQLVDLIARRRIAPETDVIERLKAIRPLVPPSVRAASARGAEGADPPAALVHLFVEDEPTIAAPLLRSARLRDDEWIAMLPVMAPDARAVLRHRGDLSPALAGLLESFGSVDSAWEAVPHQPVAEPVGESPLSFASIAPGLPVVTEVPAHDEAEAKDAADAPEPGADVIEFAYLPAPKEAASGTFQIAEMVARIDAYRQRREQTPVTPIRLPVETDLFAPGSVRAQGFRFETDAAGVVRWIEGAARAPLIGLSLNPMAIQGQSQVDGAAAGAFRQRTGFTDARLVIGGDSEAAGPWRITGIPVFDHESGRFTGYRGTARRPRPDETAERYPDPNPASDALRQLVHELRTPTSAIAGFAEMIESQTLGPVSEAYRAHAAEIRALASRLLTAIDDIDMAARIDARALDLRPGEVPLVPLLERVVGELQPLAALRGTTIDLHLGDSDLALAGDDRAVGRLISRLAATLVASSGQGERIGIAAMRDADAVVAVVFDRPGALADYAGDELLTIDAEIDNDREGAPLLGTGFALRLACNLAIELRGTLTIGDKILTLRLPAAPGDRAGRVSSS